VGLGLGAFYIALTWINTLLGVFLTPLFIIPMTWLQDRLGIGVPKRRDDGRRPPATR
jgi:predicted Na+-dependent transporter